MGATVEEPQKERTPRLDWAGLLRRAFALDVFSCVRWGGRLKGAGVPDGIRRGARHCGAPGIALSACAGSCSAGATPKRVLLSQSSGCCCQHPCRPHPVPRPAWEGGLGWAGVCPLEMNRFCAGPACGSWGSRQRPSPPALLPPATPNRVPVLTYMLAIYTEMGCNGRVP